jgi:FkbM family methyltransferase
MIFTSYAQNFEDVMLWRALRHIENGFYIDVGANDPEEDSVTKAFYDRGWCGINIEPLPEYYKRLCDARPRDINLAIAAGEADGHLTLFDVPAVRGWATPNEAVAAEHQERGFDVMALTVPVHTLAGICAGHVKGEIHFLKIDVEGFEPEVVRGMDFGKWRPWIVVIEATRPNSQITSHESWQETILQHGYQFAYFDGLNRYYVAKEHRRLLQALSTQPNVFDEFMTINQVRALEVARLAEARADQAQARVQEVERHLALKKKSIAWRFARPSRWMREVTPNQAEVKALQAEARAQQAQTTAREAEAGAQQAQTIAQEAQAKVRDLERQLADMRASTSWRLTAPLRWIARVLGKMHKKTKHRSRRPIPFKPLIKRLLRGAMQRILAWPVLAAFIHRILTRFPRLESKLHSLAYRVLRERPSAYPPDAAMMPPPGSPDKEAIRFRAQLDNELTRRRVKK